MAKEIIDAITKAETEAAEAIANAKAEGEKLIADAKARAEASYRTEVDKVRKASDDKLAAAEAEAAELIKSAEIKATVEKEALQEAAKQKKQEAVKAVIDSFT